MLQKCQVVVAMTPSGQPDVRSKSAARPITQCVPALSRSTMAQTPRKSVLNYESISIAVEDEELQEYMLSLIRSEQTQRFALTSPAEVRTPAWDCGLARPGPQTSRGFVGSMQPGVTA